MRNRTQKEDAGRASHTTCRVTGKRSYTSARVAKQASTRNGKRIRIYHCKFCRGHHITAAATRKAREVDDWN